MKKLASILLGLSLILGSAAVAFSQDKPAEKGEKKKKSSGKKKKGEKKPDEKKS